MKLSREEIANIEIGHTTVSIVQKYFIIIFFLLFIGIYPCIQIFYHQPFAEWRQKDDLQKSIKAYETAIEDTSLLRKLLLTPVQRGLVRIFNLGNEKVIVGKDGWLFFAGDYEYLINSGFLTRERLHKRMLTGVQPDPVKAILNFKEQLAERSIKLILLPVPVKPMIYSDKLCGNVGPIQNISWREFKEKLSAEGITVLDLSMMFHEMRKKGIEPYLKTDTHWTPEGMFCASAMLSEVIDGKKAKAVPEKAQTICNLGDIAMMLNLPDCKKYFPFETIHNPVFSAKINRDSDILLLGDSFANIFSLDSMKWGANSGLAEALSYHLERPVDAILRNDAGAFATRQLLSNELKRGRDRLAGKKVVVWEFAIRELVNGDWKDIDMTLGESQKTSFLAISESMTVTATVLRTTDAPRPNSAPYADHVMSLHIGDINGSAQEALVYMVSMKKNIWTEAPKLRVGDTVKLCLSPWDVYEKKYGSWNRSEFEDESLLLQEPLYGEIVK